MKFNNLQSWLSWQESLHFTDIELGLDRIQQVADQLGIPSSWHCPVITVAGTNGKGSSVALLESMFLAAGYRVGSYTSPHLLHYNERIKINAEPVSDQLICEAFEQVEQARLKAGEISLTYFEFGSLAALLILQQAGLDVVVLEVGLGGRLDAVNIIDADIALITPVALDHQGWLGDNREAIAAEKAGIIKSTSSVICSDPEPATAVVERARSLQVPAFYINREYRFVPANNGFQFSSPAGIIKHLPPPNLSGQFQLNNAAAAIMVSQLLIKELPLTAEAIAKGLLQVQLAGRFQTLAQAPEIIVDVAHNPHAVAALVENLQSRPCKGRTLAVLAMLEDKAICDSLAVIDQQIDHFYLVGLEGNRALSVDELNQRVQQCVSNDKLSAENSVAQALERAIHTAGVEDRIIVFGSFLTVTAAIEQLQQNR